MASNSDEEAGPSNKRIKPDSTEPIMDVRDMNKLFPKIDNLEHFPLKVLMNIFQRLDYMDLYNLAEKSVRFERIAKIVLNERYTHEEFIVDDTKCKKDTYIEFFKRFGNAIKTINVQKLETATGKDFWVTVLLDNSKNLEKLTLQRFPIRCYKSKVFEHVNENITHLIFNNFVNFAEDFTPSKFGKLMKLVIKDHPSISFERLSETIRNNLALKSLVLGEEFYAQETRLGTEYQFGLLVEHIGMYLKQLKELEYTPRGKKLVRGTVIIRPSHDVIERFVSSLKHLESLGFSSNVALSTDFIGLLRRMSSECKNIKLLKLCDIDGGNIKLFDIIRLFQNVESLALGFKKFGNEIISLVEHLPHLRELDVVMHTKNVDWPFIFTLLRISTTLEKLTLTGASHDNEMEWFGTNDFYTKFIESMQNPRLKMEIKFRGQSVGFISKDEVIWRNKLVHWVGYDPHLNLSNINVLDLAKEPSSADANAEQPSPFDLVLGYLDLKSLCSLSQTSKKCLQLVENHIKQHSQQQKEFTITNEFKRGFDGLEMFAEYVTNLRVNILNVHFAEVSGLLGEFNNLTKLYIYTQRNIELHNLIVPQVQHFIFDGFNFNYSQMRKLSVVCPNLETLEIKQAVDLFFEGEESLEFRNLKRFTFKTYEGDQCAVKKLQSIFKNTNTELHHIIGNQYKNQWAI